MAMATDLLTQIHAELGQRMAELRPLLDEYERLLAAADTLDAMEAEPVAADAPETPAPAIPATSKPIEYDYEPEPKRKPAASSDVKQAILAALEHGSHTVSELVMVTAMSPSEIRANLSRLARQRKVTRVKRQGDGKSAYSLPASAAHA
jgi:DNA-binding transcriptional ArsR family regulator